MAKQTINIGTSANKGDGDPIRTAFDKVNDNFDELYSDVAALSGAGNSTVDLQANVFADDSTLLVDAINGAIPAANLSGALPAIDGSALTGVASAFSDLTGTPTTVAGYGITDAFDGAFSSLTGTPTTVAGYGITDAFDGAFSSLTGTPTTVAGYGITDYGVFTGTEEAFATLTGATGTVVHDCDNGHIFYHTTPAADWTANFTNLGLTAEHATTLSIVISQGATAYIPSAIEIGGVAQTLLWQGGSAPSGTADGTDVVAFSILNDGGTYIVLGQLVDFA